MADLRFETTHAAVLIRPLTKTGQQWIARHIDRNSEADGAVSVEISDSPNIERAAREDGLLIGELAL